MRGWLHTNPSKFFFIDNVMDSLTGLKSQRQFALLELAENNKNSFLTEKNSVWLLAN